MKKLLYMAVVLAALAAILVGCTGTQQAESNPGIQIHEKSHTLVDGRRVICLYTESFVVGGYSNVRSSVYDIECEFPPRTK
jgi:hypothetical protein